MKSAAFGLLARLLSVLNNTADAEIRVLWLKNERREAIYWLLDGPSN